MVAVTAMLDVFGWAIAIGWSHVETAARARREVLTSAAFKVAGVGSDGWTLGFGLDLIGLDVGIGRSAERVIDYGWVQGQVVR